jgi:thioredoxin-related protein
MKLKFLALVLAIVFLATSSFVTTAPQWGHDLTEAFQSAKKEHKYILVNFSGSDWCGPCIRLHKEVFVMEDFLKLANEKLVLVNADFPRYKKNQLPAAQQKINDAIAERYNTKGSFPLTVLVDQDGNTIKEWEGFPSSPIEFINDIAQTIQDHK